MFEFGWQGFALLASGLFCVCLEVLVPSGGLLGIAAASCLGFGGYFAFMNGGMPAVLGFAGLSVLLVPVTALSTLKILPRTPLGKRVILSGGLERASNESAQALLGAIGAAKTPLHPCGIAVINGRRVDVITRGESIEAESVVRVIQVEGQRIVVESWTQN